MKKKTILSAQDWIKEVIPVQTNIVVGILKDPTYSGGYFIKNLKYKGILVVDFGNGRIRLTTTTCP